MNADIATAAGWTQEDRKVQQTNIALNEFDAAMHQAMTDTPVRTREHALITRQLIKARSAQRLRAMNIAIARVGAQLARIEGPR